MHALKHSGRGLRSSVPTTIGCVRGLVLDAVSVAKDQTANSLSRLATMFGHMDSLDKTGPGPAVVSGPVHENRHPLFLFCPSPPLLLG